MRLSARNLLHVITAREITARIRVQLGHALNHYARDTFKQCENYSIRTEELQTTPLLFFFFFFLNLTTWDFSSLLSINLVPSGYVGAEFKMLNYNRNEEP